VNIIGHVLDSLGFKQDLKYSMFDSLEFKKNAIQKCSEIQLGKGNTPYPGLLLPDSL